MTIQNENGAVKSHIAHEQHMNNLIHEKEKRFYLHKKKDCVAYILHTRTLDLLKPFYKNRSTWLTVGDYNGFEALYLKEHNQSAIASDISDPFLKEALLQGFIDEYRKENIYNLE